MVSQKMERYGRVVAEFDAGTYLTVASHLRENLPRSVKTEIERVRTEYGGNRVRLWCQNPQVIMKILDELMQQD